MKTGNSTEHPELTEAQLAEHPARTVRQIGRAPVERRLLPVGIIVAETIDVILVERDRVLDRILVIRF